MTTIVNDAVNERSPAASMLMRCAVTLLLVSALFFEGCAFFKPRKVEETVVVVPVVAPPNTAEPTSNSQPSSEPSFSEVDRSDLTDLENLKVDLEYADIFITSGAVGKKKGILRISRMQGDASCKVNVQEEKGVLKIHNLASIKKFLDKISAITKISKSQMPAPAKCRFSVEISVPEAVPLQLALKRGSVLVENWDEPISMKVDWGDIDVGTIDELNVECGRCTLTGEGVTGPLKYNLDRGNVGLAGLSNSVEGKTLGDVVLKWLRVKNETSVKVLSRAGDVILSFPYSIPIQLDAKAPRGEVYSNFTNGQTGLPISVVAEQGNVRLFRAPGNVTR